MICGGYENTDVDHIRYIDTKGGKIIYINESMKDCKS